MELCHADGGVIIHLGGAVGAAGIVFDIGCGGIALVGGGLVGLAGPGDGGGCWCRCCTCAAFKENICVACGYAGAAEIIQLILTICSGGMTLGVGGGGVAGGAIGGLWDGGGIIGK